MADAGTSAEPEASSDHDTPKEPDDPSSFVDDPEGVQVSVRSSSDWEEVTTPNATFLGVDLGALVAWEGVEVSGVTLIIRANDHASRLSDKLQSPAWVDLVFLRCHGR